MKRLVLLICSCVALAAIAAACGGAGDTGSSSAAGGGGEFAEEANAACTSANQKVAALTTPEGEAELLSYLEENESIVEGLRQEITALGGSGKPLQAYEAGLQESTDVLNQMSNAARSRNPGAVGELANQLAEIRLATLAEAAGLEDCAKAPEVQP